jgi:carbon-monoxide dehydrogenase medium subunit
MRDAEASLVGSQPSAEAFAAAAADAAGVLEPASDIHGSAAFRRQLAAVVIRRSLAEAAERAGGR